MRNAFYEITEPIYALIKAPDLSTALKVYREDVLGEVDATDKIVWKELLYPEAFHVFYKATEDEFKMGNIHEILKSQPPEVLLLDVAYM